MRIQTKYLSTLIFCLSSIGIFAQYQSPSRIENYAGSSSIFLNPASSSVFPLRWDLNLISGAFHVDNSVGYISNASIADLINDSDQIILEVMKQDTSASIMKQTYSLIARMK